MNKFRETYTAMQSLGHLNFCAPLAHCIATDSKPENTLTLFKALGRQDKAGSRPPMILEAFRVSGYTLELIAGEFNLKTCRSRLRCPSRSKYGATFTTASKTLARHKGAYLLFSRSHVQLVKDGEVHDWAKEGRHRIIAVFKINKVY